jgi:hypothetical protein
MTAPSRAFTCTPLGFTNPVLIFVRYGHDPARGGSPDVHPRSLTGMLREIVCF